eukprot:gene3209-3685_t
MSSLADGQHPEIGKITIAEQNAELCHKKINQRNKGCSKADRAKFPDYRRYDLTGAALKSPQSLAHESKIPAFIPAQSNAITKFYDTWESYGFVNAMQELDDSTDAPKTIKMLSKAVVKTVSALEAIKDKVFTKKLVPEDEIIKRYFLMPNWSQGAIKAFGIHPHVHSFAVAYKDDTVKLFSTNSFNDFEPVMKDKKQKDVTCIEFRPLSAAHVAVGCKKGILVWLLDPNSSGLRPGANQHRFLSQPGHCPITTLSWSKSGRLLASGSPNDSAVMIWDILLQRSTPLRRIGAGISFLRWSPCESQLFSATTSDMFRIWETNTWTCERWSNLAGRCQASCWSPCGRYLIFTVEDEPSLYYLYFSHGKDSSTSHLSSSGLAVKCFDFSEFTWNTELGDSVSAGGIVQFLAWDPTGSRIAATFRDAKESGNVQTHIAILRTVLEPVFEVTACGFVGGGENEKPLSVSFMPEFGKGALMMVCWSSGMVSQIPLLFIAPALASAASLGYQNVLTSSPSETSDKLETLHSIGN